MTSASKLEAAIAAVPKAELHVHLEGAIAPETASLLSSRRGVKISAEQVAQRYQHRDFAGFIEAFKWVTSLLQSPLDYALITQRLAEDLIRQNVIYAEVTLSVGVMLLRKQDVQANFEAIRDAGDRYAKKGLRLQWIFDAVRQFGAKPAMEVAALAAKLQPEGVVAFGMGGDELGARTSDFRAVYDFARQEGLHLLIHAGEIGGPDSVVDALDQLGVERIGHGIAVMRDPELAKRLANRRIALENCITSNVRTGALAIQTGKPDASITDHPLPKFLEDRIDVTLSTDDPAMFGTDLLREYSLAASLGLDGAAIARLAENSFHAAFVPVEEKRALLQRFRTGLNSSGLL